MPKKQVEQIDGDTRMDLDHIAVNMYSERMKEDASNEQAEIYGRSPDARQLYFKGVQDTLVSLDHWAKLSIPKALMTQIIDKLIKQTKNDNTH